MEITEKDLEDLIFKDLRKTRGLILAERGLSLQLTDSDWPNTVCWRRQVDLKGYGIADIIGYSRLRGVIHVDLIELKNKPLKSEDFNQVLRYKKAIQILAENTFKKRRMVMVNSILIGPDIESGHYIHNDAGVNVFTFEFNVDGFDFEYHSASWHRPDTSDIKYVDVRSSDFLKVLPIEKEHAEQV